MLKILFAVFFAASIFIAIKNYGLAGVGLMGAGFAGGLSVAAWIIDKDRKKFRSKHIHFYDKDGKPVAPFIGSESKCREKN